MRLLFELLSGTGGRGRLSTLILHRVVPTPDPLFPGELDAAGFDQLCSWVKRWFRVLPLSEAVDLLLAGRLPSRALALTFDDGYADNHDIALPILERHGLTATFFVATGFLDGGRMWNDTLVEIVRRVQTPELDVSGIPGVDLGMLDLRGLEARRAAVTRLLPAFKYLPMDQRLAAVDALAARAAVPLPDDLMMRSDMVLAMRRRGMEIGAHTVHHPILKSLSDGQATAELADSRRQLEALTGAPVTLFAYPNGKPGTDYGPRDAALARELGFSAAFTTAPGAASAASDPFQLPRFTPWRRQRLPFAAQMARNLIDARSATA